jgi:rhodanese-related sulfurtransferase
MRAFFLPHALRGKPTFPVYGLQICKKWPENVHWFAHSLYQSGEITMHKRSALQWFIVMAAGLCIHLSASAAETPATLAGVKVVAAEEAKKLQDGGVPLIDTRVAAEYAEKTAKGAKSVPYKEKSEKVVGFDASKDDFDLSKLPSDKAAPMVLFCNAGECWKSYKAAIAAQKAGYSKIYWLRGGFPEWSAKGLPTQ